MKWLLSILILLACECAPAAIQGTSLCWQPVAGSNLVYRVWRVGYYGHEFSNTVHMVQEGTNLCYNFGSAWPPQKYYLTTYDTVSAAESDASTTFYTIYLHINLAAWQHGWIEFSRELLDWYHLQPVFFGGSFNFPVDPEEVRMFVRFKPDDA